MAQPWDDDADSDPLDRLIRAYGRGEIDLWPMRAAGPAPAAQYASPAPQAAGAAPEAQFASLGPTPAESRGGLGAGFTPVSARLGVQAIPTPVPLPPLPAGDPNQVGKALSDIWNGLRSLHPPPGAGVRTSKPTTHEDECWDLLNDDMAQCGRLGRRSGFEEEAICKHTAMDRYGECIQGGSGRVRTPLYKGW